MFDKEDRYARYQRKHKVVTARLKQAKGRKRYLVNTARLNDVAVWDYEGDDV